MTQIVDAFYQALINRQSPSEYLAEEAVWGASHPINDLKGREQIIEEYWQPLIHALPDIERKPTICVEENINGTVWLCETGYFVGTFTNPLFDIPASGRTLYLRYTEMTCVEHGQIQQSYVILDFLDAMNQVGVNPIRQSLGHVGLVPPPATQDGLSRPEATSVQGEKTAALVNDMLAELGRFDGQSLDSMKLENYWHPDFMWYGPAGIGTTRGISGFRKHHQGPFVFAFPDRSIDHHLATLKSGHYAATGGWPHMHGTHSGPHWLGLAPTNKNISLRVMDIWRREGDLLVENWVGIDIIHMLYQLGLDVFEQMRLLRGLTQES